MEAAITILAIGVAASLFFNGWPSFITINKYYDGRQKEDDTED